MDRPGANVWAATFHQMMAERKPRDTWVLLPEDSLVAGRPDHGCFQYRLKGLAGLQCGHCPWGWGSAHVQVLFHLWWDEESRKGLVKMRVWGQQCRLCPLGTPGNCQVSPLSVRPFLNKLALHVLRKCYGESPGPDQWPGLYYKAPGDAPRPCEACILGVCFLQKGPGLAPDPDAIRGTYIMYSSVGLTITVSGGEGKVPRSTQLLTLGSWPTVRRPRGSEPCAVNRGCFTIPLSVSDFIKNPLTDSSHFFSKGEGIITIPFSLADDSKDKGPIAHSSSCVPTKDGSLPATGTGGPVTIGKGSLCLSSNSMAIPKGKGIPVNIKDPIFHGKGLLISNIESKGFELKGFIFKGKGSISDPIDVAKVQGLVYNSDGATAAGKTPVPVSYIIGLMANGEGSITFPLSFTNIIKGKDSFTNITEGKGKEGCSNGSAITDGDTLLETNASGSTTNDEGAITFPFIFTDGIKGKDSHTAITKGKGKEDGSNGPASTGDDPPETKAGASITNNEGAIASPTDNFKGKDSSTDTTKNEGEENGGNSSLTMGHNPLSEFNASGLITNEEGASTSSTDNVQDKDSPTDSTEGKEKENGGNDPATPGHGFLLKTNAAGSVTFSEGSITIPFSVFNIIKRKGPSASANGPQNDGFLPHGYSKKKKRLRFRFGKSSCGPRRDEDFGSSSPCHGPRAEPHDDVWIWVAMTVCVLWLMCVCRLSPGLFQQQV
ncbi:receptor-transporting protein 5 [Elephas maximus indicus]|uniref:receptor-transporting protein 5 n=1 Tax=Elephas maximus indicus TaxID=99487 RepID=UPI002116588F|nr:receptor-transporting protein 5 [Elephas maximus indicus]